MKKPDKFIGYIKYDNSDFPFHFNEEDFTLTLFPPTIEKWKETSSIIEFFKRLSDESTNNRKKYEWIKDINLQGTTADGNNIIFNVMDNRSNNNGIYSYDVNWYLYYQNNTLAESISGFKVSSPEINGFFPPIVALNSSISVDNQTNKIKEINVASNGFITKQLGKYRISTHIDASMSVSAYTIADIRNAAKPISAISSMETSFSSPVDYNVLIRAISYLNTFLAFITYRRNISLDRIEVAFKDQQGEDGYLGVLCFKTKMDSETDKRSLKRIIDYFVLDQKIPKIFVNIKNKKYSFRHLCDSAQSMHSYSSSRIIMILAAFERTYRSIYGEDFGRSAEYVTVKAEIVELINNYAKTKHGKSKGYAKTLSKFVNNRDSSFGDNLKRALIDHKEIMKPFVGKKYHGEYEEVVEGISSRMGEVRNGIAHDKLDWHFDAIHLCDIKIVEELLYAMILKDLHLDSKKIQKGINDLFDENFAIALS